MDVNKLQFDSVYNEAVFVNLKLNNGKRLTLGNIYRSPSSSKQDDEKLCNLIDEVVAATQHGLLLVGDFNFPNIDWDIFYSDTIGGSSQMFLNTLHKNLLTQHVDFPTRARGTDSPHILDLVITNDPLVNKIEDYAPLGKSDHAVLLIETNILEDGEVNFKKLNFKKGDYESFRTYMLCDWDLEFSGENLEDMWVKLKDRLVTGTSMFIPKVKDFRSKNGKWTRPIKEEIRKEIRLKSKLWKKYMNDMDFVSLQNYKKQHNKVKNLIRRDERLKQSEIAKDSKNNPKRFWNYVNSRTKNKERVGDLKVVKNDKTVIADTDALKAEELNDFFLVSLFKSRIVCLRNCQLDVETLTQIQYLLGRWT